MPTDEREDARHDRLLPWIAAERTVRAALLIALGVVLVTRTHTDWGRVIAHVARHFGLDPTRNRTGRLVAKAHALTPGKERAYGVVALAYGALEGAEAYGLATRKVWGELLTVVATSLLFIPEIWELVDRPTAFKVAALIVNLAIVVYLVVRLRRHRREGSPETFSRPRSPASRG